MSTELTEESLKDLMDNAWPTAYHGNYGDYEKLLEICNNVDMTIEQLQNIIANNMALALHWCRRDEKGDLWLDGWSSQTEALQTIRGIELPSMVSLTYLAISFDASSC